MGLKIELADSGRLWSAVGPLLVAFPLRPACFYRVEAGNDFTDEAAATRLVRFDHRAPP